MFSFLKNNLFTGLLVLGTTATAFAQNKDDVQLSPALQAQPGTHILIKASTPGDGVEHGKTTIHYSRPVLSYRVNMTSLALYATDGLHSKKPNGIIEEDEVQTFEYININQEGNIVTIMGQNMPGQNGYKVETVKQSINPTNNEIEQEREIVHKKKMFDVPNLRIILKNLSH